jgi:hypothetical protein
MSDQSRKDLVTCSIFEEDERCIHNFGQKVGMVSNYSGEIGDNSN